MGEFAKQLEKYRKEYSTLGSLHQRLSLRLGDISKQIQALETLEKQAEAIADSRIPDEALSYLDSLFPSNGSKRAETPVMILANPPYVIDPSQKSHIVLSVMYHQQKGEMSSAEVFDAVRSAGYKLSKQDVYKVLSRQVKMRRVSKSASGAFALTEAGAKIVKLLNSEAHLVE